MAKKKSEQPKDDEFTSNVNHPHYPIYKPIEHYYINRNGWLCYSNGEKIYVLCNGSMAIIKETWKMNGSSEAEIWFTIEVIMRNGSRRLIEVPAVDFNSLNWVTKNLGTALVVMPNQTVKQTLTAGLLMSGENCKRERVCTCAGYVKEKGIITNYISASGPIIPSEIRSELDPNLKRYAMSAPSENEAEVIAAIKSALNLLSAHVPDVTGVSFAFVFLSAILPIVNDIVGDVGFLLFLSGKTQSGKSQLAALIASFFGRFDPQTPPTTFESTANAIMVMAYILKDMPLWIDDYNPQEYMKAMNQIFQMLARAAGDHSTRRRLDSNAKLKESYPPRCLFLVTGEFPPKIGHSGHARVFQVDVPYARMDISAIKEDARNGVLSRCMADYIVYIINNFDRLKETARRQYEDILHSTNEKFGENRLSNQCALLCLSAGMFLEYAVDCKALTNGEAKNIYRTIEASITFNARKKEEQLVQEDPCTLYINAVYDLLSSGRARVIDLSKKEAPEEIRNYDYTSLNLGPEKDGYIGWKDERGYYLNTNASYAAVMAYYARQDMNFITNANTLWRQLRDAKILIPDKNNNPCQNKKIGKYAKRVLMFPRKVFDPSEE